MIHGIEGTEPVGCALTVGRRRGNSPVPVEKDVFHIMTARQTANGNRETHPAFAWWEQLDKADRKTVRGVLVGPWDRMFRQSYRAQIIKGRSIPPGNQPKCVGDGQRARRFAGEKGSDDWREIVCAGEQCPFRQETTDDNGKPIKAQCSPSTLLLFRLDFPAWIKAKYEPLAPVARFASNGWRSFRNSLGLREHLDRAAADLGLADYSPVGFRFTINLVSGKGEKGGKSTSFPVAEFSPDESAHDFLIGATRRQIPTTHVAAITADDEYQGHLATRGGPTIEGA